MVMALSLAWSMAYWFNFEAIIAFLLSLPTVLGYWAKSKGKKGWPDWLKKIAPILLIASIAALLATWINSREVFKLCNPVDSQHTTSPITVSGCYRNLPKDNIIWVAVQDKESGIFFFDSPMATRVGNERKGQWEVPNLSIGSFDDEGKTFHIYALVVPEKSAAQQTILAARKDPASQGIQELPSFTKSKKITVILQH